METQDLLEQENLQENVIPALIATLLSGASTGIGGLLIMFYGKPSNTKVGHMLSFSAGVMIYISFMDLLLESQIAVGFFMANTCFVMGMLFFAAIVWCFPEPKLVEKVGKSNNKNNDTNNNKDSENSRKQKNNNLRKRVNTKDDTSSTLASDNSNNSIEQARKTAYLKQLGVITAVGISLHNFPEGMAVYVSCMKGVAVGLPLTLAIAAHNIPEGIAVAAPIYEATGSKWQAFWYSLLSGLCEPLGAVIFGYFCSAYINAYLIQCLLAAVAGIMVYMSVCELLPAVYKYVKPKKAAISLILGMVIIAASIHYLHGMLPHDHKRLYWEWPSERAARLAAAAAATLAGGAHEHGPGCVHH